MLFHRFPIEHLMDLLAVIYRYHKRNFNKDIPYFSTLSSILILLIINGGSVLALLDKKHTISFGESASKFTEYIIGLICLIPAILILAILFPPSKIKKRESELSEKEYKVGKYIFLGIYLLSIVVFIAVIKRESL